MISENSFKFLKIGNATTFKKHKYFKLCYLKH